MSSNQSKDNLPMSVAVPEPNGKSNDDVAITQSSVESKPNIRTPLITGLLIIALFFGVFIFWSFFSPLDSAAIAPGEVSVESKRKTIQHLEGGIVGAILVQEGDVVQPGQTLLKLDETQPLANLSLLQSQFYATRGYEARLQAERDLRDSIKFSEALEKKRATNAEVKEILEIQERIFKVRNKEKSGKEAILKQRIAQYEEEVNGLKEQVTAQEEHIDLINSEINALLGLVEKGMSGKQRLLELQRELATVKGEKAKNKSSIAQIGQHIIETRMEINDLATTRMNEVVQELRDVQTQLYDLREKLRAAEDVLKRTAIIAPMGGTVVGLNIHTLGGVISPGQALMDIVPANERLIIETRINPIDIDVVEPGLAAKVRFTALNQRRTKPVEGTVVTVSADRFQDERTGEVYYSAIVELNENLKEALGEEELHPGMQVEVMILTGARTLMEYFLQPITDSMRRAFREQ